jgi:hypothetical protein
MGELLDYILWFRFAYSYFPVNRPGVGAQHCCALTTDVVQIHDFCCKLTPMCIYTPLQTINLLQRLLTDMILVITHCILPSLTLRLDLKIARSPFLPSPPH